MKDLIGREVQVGNYIAYALTAGRSANLAIYKVHEVYVDTIKAHKIDQSYGQWNGLVTVLGGEKVPATLAKFVYVPGGESYYRKKTQTELDKEAQKTTTLKMSERIFILDGFTPEVLQRSEEPQ